MPELYENVGDFNQGGLGLKKSEAGIRLIIRGDDCGGSRSANLAIWEACEAGMLKNVSLMAVGPAIEEAATLFAHRTDVCFGMHITMNAEWDQVKWKPLLPPDKVSQLIDSQGYFLSSPSEFGNQNTLLHQAIDETMEQFRILKQLGFRISYVDEHMFFGYSIPGYHERLDMWCREQGLINFHKVHRALPDHGKQDEKSGLPSGSLADHYFCNHIESLAIADAGIYTVICHPGLDSEEMRLMGNSHISGAQIARERNAERLMLMNPKLRLFYAQHGIETIRYDELLIP